MHPDRRGFAFKALVDISESCIPIPNIQASWEEKCIAEGGFGTVRRGKLDGKYYVLKTLRPLYASDVRKLKVVLKLPHWYDLLMQK